MKRVLILTYYWPPSGGAGVQRWLKFARYLRTYGWEPVIYTVENGEMPVEDKSLEKDIPQGLEVIKTPIWEPYDVYKKFIGQRKDEKINAGFLSERKKNSALSGIAVWIRGNFFIPDARKFWIKPSVRFLSAYLKKTPVQAIISSGPPHSMHLIGRGLKKEFPALKWIADFRDPWTNIDFYEELKLTALADAKHRKLEKAVLKESDAVISIGETMNEEFKGILNDVTQHAKFHVITNGYDEEDLKDVSAPEKDVFFTIAHIGTLVKSRNPLLLWEVLKELLTEYPEFADRMRIKLVGKIDVAVNESIRQAGLDPFVIRIDYMPHSEVVKELCKSHVNLLLVNRTKNAKGILTGKFFEYLLAGVPVLAIGPTDGDLSAILHETGSGYISDFEDRAGLKRNILTLFRREYPHRNEPVIARYSRKALTGRLAALLDKISA